jgi:hypothetical protein
MKKMLIAASAVGATIAGLILYTKKKSGNKLISPSIDGSPDRKQAIDLRSHHAMG